MVLKVKSSPATANTPTCQSQLWARARSPRTAQAIWTAAAARSQKASTARTMLPKTPLVKVPPTPRLSRDPQIS